jgi:hypothetical protein
MHLFPRFRRLRPASARPASPAAPLVAPPSEWKNVGPIQRVVAAPQRVINTGVRGPATFADPRMTSGDLGHYVSADAPGGVMHGLLSTRIGQPQPLDLAMPPLPVESRAPEPTPQPEHPVVRVQRATNPGRMTSAAPLAPVRRLAAVRPTPPPAHPGPAAAASPEAAATPPSRPVGGPANSPPDQPGRSTSSASSPPHASNDGQAPVLQRRATPEVLSSQPAPGVSSPPAAVTPTASEPSPNSDPAVQRTSTPSGRRPIGLGAPLNSTTGAPGGEASTTPTPAPATRSENHPDGQPLPTVRRRSRIGPPITPTATGGQASTPPAPAATHVQRTATGASGPTHPSRSPAGASPEPAVPVTPPPDVNSPTPISAEPGRGPRTSSSDRDSRAFSATASGSSTVQRAPAAQPVQEASTATAQESRTPPPASRGSATSSASSAPPSGSGEPAARPLLPSRLQHHP